MLWDLAASQSCWPGQWEVCSLRKCSSSGWQAGPGQAYLQDHTGSRTAPCCHMHCSLCSCPCSWSREKVRSPGEHAGFRCPVWELEGVFPDGPCPGWQEDLGMGSAVFPAKSKAWPKSWADVPEVIPESRTKSVSRARGE